MLKQLLNSYFTNVLKSLEIPESENIDQLYEQIQTPTLKAIVKFIKHPKIKVINDSFTNRCFPFSTIEKKDVSNENNKLNSRKAIQDTNILVKDFERKCRLFCLFFNIAISLSKFPLFLKCANVTSVFKKSYKNLKDNYRPVSILPVIFRIFEKLMSKTTFYIF